MSFKLTIEINDDATTNVDFDGTINHIVLLGVLESVKHGVLGTAEILAAQDVLLAAEEGNGQEQPEAAPAPQGD